MVDSPSCLHRLHFDIHLRREGLRTTRLDRSILGRNLCSVTPVVHELFTSIQKFPLQVWVHVMKRSEIII